MAKAVLTFALYQADQLTRRETVTQDIVKVGKDPKSHLRVDDELASRMHAVIEVAGPEDITLIDLGNEPGTMVNGARVNKCKLHVGDQIQVGDTKIILESAEAAGAEAAPPAAPAFAAAPNPFASASASSPFAAASNPFATSSNPFAAGAAAARQQQQLHVPDDAAPGTYTYTMVKSGPDVSPDEVEISHLASVEVMVLWVRTYCTSRISRRLATSTLVKSRARTSPATSSSPASGSAPRACPWSSAIAPPWRWSFRPTREAR